MGIRVKANRWCYRFRLNGRQYEGSTGLAATKQNESAAKAIEARERIAYADGLAREGKRRKSMPFVYAQEQFLEWCKMRYRLRPNSEKRIRGSFASVGAFFGDVSLAEVSSQSAVERYKVHRVAEHQVKDVTLRNDLNALSLFFGFCIRSGWLLENPLKGENKVHRPSGEDAVRMHIVTPEEECAYFTACANRPNIHDVAKLILLQGCRPDEVMALRKLDYNRSKRTIRIVFGKTKAAKRELSLLSESAAIVERRMKMPGEWLFPSPRKAESRIRQMDHTHVSVLQDAKLDWFVLYDFRHTFATRMVEEGQTDLPTLAAIMGHSGLRMVMKYVHPTAEHQKKAMQRYEASRKPRLFAVTSK